MARRFSRPPLLPLGLPPRRARAPAKDESSGQPGLADFLLPGIRACMPYCYCSGDTAPSVCGCHASSNDARVRVQFDMCAWVHPRVRFVCVCNVA